MAIVGLLVFQTTCAQQAPVSGTEVVLPNQLQRLVQYEQILGHSLDASTGLCMDTMLDAQWRLPDEPAAVQIVLVKTESIVRQEHDNCLAMTQGKDLRMVKELRMALDKQRHMALANERLAIARRCLQPNSELLERKGCLQEATGSTFNATQWQRWEVLYQLNQGRR